jgi:hypothetical protein
MKNIDIKLFKRIALYIIIIENKMTGSIFSNLPNDIIMNIIKMAEDERKLEKNKKHICDELLFHTHFKSHHIPLSTTFSNFKNFNYIYKEYYYKDNILYEPQLIEEIKEREQYEKERHEEELMDDPEYIFEHRYDNLEPCEEDYDWGFEPSWA